MFDWIAEKWCRAMHESPMWPINGQYTCPKCLRHYAVPWEAPLPAEEYSRPDLRPRVTVSAETVSALQ